VIYCVTGVAVAGRLGIPVTSLVAPAAVLAVALGFGAQRIIQDILAGFFIITERQYGFGGLGRLSVAGLPDTATGTVEDVTLRVTTVRTADGEVVPAGPRPAPGSRPAPPSPWPAPPAPGPPPQAPRPAPAAPGPLPRPAPPARLPRLSARAPSPRPASPGSRPAPA
jgi:hypothetical protein